MHLYEFVVYKRTGDLDVLSPLKPWASASKSVHMNIAQDSACDLEHAAEACYFEYNDGASVRGLSQGRSSGYGTAFVDENALCHRSGDEAVQLGALVEDAQAVMNLPEILDVTGLDFVFPGPGDLGVSMGHPLEYDHPEVSDRIEYIEETCRDRGILCSGCITATLLDEVDFSRLSTAAIDC